MREFLGLSTESTEVSVPSLDERIEAVINDKLSIFSANCNELFTRLQERIQRLEEQLDEQPMSDRLSVDVDKPVYTVDNALTQAELAKRLGVDSATLTKNRKKDNFSDWVKGKDPEGLNWEYNPSLKRYSPLSTNLSTESTIEASLADH